MFIQQPHLALPPETEIRNPALNQNFPNQTPSTIPHINPVSTPTVHIPVHIALDPVRRPRIRHREDPSINEKGARIYNDDIERVDRRRPRRIRRSIPVDKIRVRDIYDLLARREADAVGAAEAVGHDTDVAAAGVEAVDLLRQLRGRAEALLVAVDGVGEPEAAVRVDDDVVGRVEGAAVVVVEQGGGAVRPLGFHVDEAARLVQRALGAEEDAVAVVDAAVSHVIALRAADFVAGEVFGPEDFDFGDGDGLVGCADGAGVVVGDVVGCDEEGVGGSVEDAGFVKEWSSFVFNQELELRRRPEEGEEHVVVDEKGSVFGVGDCATVASATAMCSKNVVRCKRTAIGLRQGG